VNPSSMKPVGKLVCNAHIAPLSWIGTSTKKITSS
jgi:hypothetical protein